MATPCARLAQPQGPALWGGEARALPPRCSQRVSGRLSSSSSSRPRADSHLWEVFPVCSALPLPHPGGAGHSRTVDLSAERFPFVVGTYELIEHGPPQPTPTPVPRSGLVALSRSPCEGGHRAHGGITGLHGRCRQRRAQPRGGQTRSHAQALLSNSRRERLPVARGGGCWDQGQRRPQGTGVAGAPCGRAACAPSGRGGARALSLGPAQQFAFKRPRQQCSEPARSNLCILMTGTARFPYVQNQCLVMA